MSRILSAVFVCSILPMLITPLSDTSLKDMLSSCNVLLFLRHSLMATAPSSDIVFSEMSSICTVVLLYKKPHTRIAPASSKPILCILHDLPTNSIRYISSHDILSACNPLPFLR